MAAAIRKAFPQAKVKLSPGGRGDFIVTVDGTTLWDKKAMDDAFPEEPDVLAQMGRG